jgi:predicted HicB family RNase H-like nuclease
MRRSNFALRVPPTLLAKARKAAESLGVALNQLITLASSVMSMDLTYSISHNSQPSIA